MKKKEKPDNTFDLEFQQLLARRRLDEMGKLQNGLVAVISEAHLPSQDVYMVLTVLRTQLESLFNKGVAANQALAPKEKTKEKPEKDK